MEARKYTNIVTYAMHYINRRDKTSVETSLIDINVSYTRIIHDSISSNWLKVHFASALISIYVLSNENLLGGISYCKFLMISRRPTWILHISNASDKSR